MAVKKVFVSSTTSDLVQYREAARDVIAKVTELFGGHFVLVPVAMDTQMQDAERTTPLDVSRSWVRESDWVVLIVAWNYGWIPPGQTCSVAESEYKEAIDKGKQCFVYLPGEVTDPPEFKYRSKEIVERKDLTDWRGHPDGRAQEAGLNKFKAALRDNKRFDLFRNIEDFRIKLNSALIQKITNELFKTLGPEIVALGLQPPLQACIREVKTLARLKRLHDRLHRIRQSGIRRWRESLLMSWPEDGNPPWQNEREYLLGLPVIRELIGKIGELVAELPEELRKSLPHLKQVVDHKFPTVPECGKQSFSDSTEVFASRVQKAFSGCNLQMRFRAQLLDQEYEGLTNRTRKALKLKQVLPKREDPLRSELDRSTQFHQRLQQVLQNHYKWQEIHDELERIDSGIESDGPSDDEVKLNSRKLAFRRAVAGLAESGGAEIRELLAAATNMVTPEEAERLKLWPGLTLKVSEHLDAFIKLPEVGHYEGFRKHFDDLFFEIDTETLRAVETSEHRVRAIEAGLQGKDVVPVTIPGVL